MRRKIYSRFRKNGIALTFILFLYFSNCVHQVVPQATDCNDPLLSPNFCDMSCGTNANAQCDPVSGSCYCRPDCYTGDVPTPPDPLGGNCPLPADVGTAIPGIPQACDKLCTDRCPVGSINELCGDTALNALIGFPGTSQVCGCACQADPCPPPPAPPTPPSMLLENTLRVLAKLLAKKLKIFLITLKKLYGILFFVTKVIVTETLVIGWMWYLLTFGDMSSQLQFIMSSLPLNALNATQALPDLFKLL